MSREGRVVIFLLAVCFLAACSSGEQKTLPVPAAVSSPVAGDAIVEGTIGEASTLIPILASDSASHAVAGQVYNGLVKYDKNLTIVGDLAESFDISTDGLTITFNLRKGVKWHDGAPFTSRDVLYTYRVIIDPKTPTAYAEDFKQVKNLVALDDYTVRATYGSPYAPALASWGTHI
jgi:peptide/nickel transport system substrate-binding protein